MIFWMLRKLLRLFHRIKSVYHTSLAKLRMGSYGEGLKVNGKSYFSRSVSVGDHCNFNGMIASGGGQNIHWKLFSFGC